MINSEMRYIYFEIHWCVGSDPQPPSIKYENILLFKPTVEIDSCGVYGHRNVAEKRYTDGGVTHHLKEQVWIDLNIYKPDADAIKKRIYFNHQNLLMIGFKNV